MSSTGEAGCGTHPSGSSQGHADSLPLAFPPHPSSASAPVSAWLFITLSLAKLQFLSPQTAHSIGLQAAKNVAYQILDSFSSGRLHSAKQISDERLEIEASHSQAESFLKEQLSWGTWQERSLCHRVLEQNSGSPFPNSLPQSGVINTQILG